MSNEDLLQPTPGARLTLEEWAALDEDVTGELVDGRLEDEEEDWFGHAVLVAALGSLLVSWARPLGGLVAASQAKFALSERRGRKPDLTLYMPGRRPPARGLIRVPPDIGVEIVSPTPRDARRDRVEKVDDYAAFGVCWYWIVPVPGCEGLTLDLDELWGGIDRLAAEEPDSSSS